MNMDSADIGLQWSEMCESWDAGLKEERLLCSSPVFFSSLPSPLH